MELSGGMMPEISARRQGRVEAYDASTNTCTLVRKSLPAPFNGIVAVAFLQSNQPDPTMVFLSIYDSWSQLPTTQRF